MIILVKRKDRSDLRCIGTFEYAGASLFCMEDADRGLKAEMPLSGIQELKIKGKTAIPYGRYEVVITFSNRFKKPLPLLLNVPGFEGVRIHSGNTQEDTEGCLLLGTTRNENMVLNSRVAMSVFMEWLKKTLLTEKVFIEISK